MCANVHFENGRPCSFQWTSITPGPIFNVFFRGLKQMEDLDLCFTAPFSTAQVHPASPGGAAAGLYGAQLQ